MKNTTTTAALIALLTLGACGKSEVPAEAPNVSEEVRGSAKHATISAEAAKAAGIQTSQAGSAALRELLPLYGVIQPNADQMRQVSARFAGVVRSVHKAVGESVKSGDVLATVESNDSLQTYPVTAPIAGVITARFVNPGETVAEKPLFVVADLSTVWVELSLFPRDRPRVRTGQHVRVKSVDGGLSGSGKIVWVSPLGASANQSITARVLLDNGQRQWTPGLYVFGEVVLNQADVPLAVRATAVQTLDGQATVFVPTAQGFDARPVRLGRSDGEVTEVLDGLKAGEYYVSINSFVIKAEIGKTGIEAD